nr:hypothetical protein [uncultured Desulfobulbus sp.]
MQQSSSETILSCLQTHTNISRKSYKNAVKETEQNYTAKNNAYNSLQVICINIHPYASYSQFRKGKKQLADYMTQHPNDTSGLGGLEYLLEQMNRERAARRNLSNKIEKEKQSLNLKNKELIDQNSRLKSDAEQDKARLNELRKQIDQLKNIESIIKNREH